MVALKAATSFLLAPAVQIGTWLDSENYWTLVIRRVTSPESTGTNLFGASSLDQHLACLWELPDFWFFICMGPSLFRVESVAEELRSARGFPLEFLRLYLNGALSV